MPTESDLFAGGSVRVPKSAPWLEDFTAELLAFPGRHDDQVDALTQGLAWGRYMWSHRVRFGRVFQLMTARLLHAAHPKGGPGSGCSEPSQGG